MLWYLLTSLLPLSSLAQMLRVSVQEIWKGVETGGEKISFGEVLEVIKKFSCFHSFDFDLLTKVSHNCHRSMQWCNHCDHQYPTKTLMTITTTDVLSRSVYGLRPGAGRECGGRQPFPPNNSPVRALLMMLIILMVILIMHDIYADDSFLFDDARADTYALAEADRASFVGCWFLVDECQSADIRTVAKIILAWIWLPHQP